MPLYFGNNDINLINSLNQEVINSIIDTEVSVFKLSIYDTEENLYGESLKKVYFPGVQLAGLVDHEDESFETDDFGPNLQQSITINFHRETLRNINLYPEVGDVIEWNDKQYEVGGIIENQFLGGQVTLNHSIICQCHLTRKSRTLISKIKRIASEESIDALYR
jgi:hypothetical protein